MFLCPECGDEAHAAIRLDLFRTENQLDFANLPDPPKKAKPLTSKRQKYRDPFDGGEMVIE
jgi:hypothetical protein